MRLLPLLGLALLAACAGPKPCTRTLCVERLDGTMRLEGWNGGVTATASTPQPPVVADTAVTMQFGSAELRNGTTRVTASEGSSFKFFVSTRAIPSLELSSGTVTVSLSSGPAAPLVPGVPFYLPKP